ncbi:hypothetical protein Lepto782_12460 [Leptospira interrogans serovar Canicola]|uniref:Uncharacterized protein n=1 Tax=Leptospira interrogans serovar Canicola TaxID=211880 RepID=A0AAP9WCQ7_LEPIR|nr:hypothetical protein [Leptospira interrogans]QOI42989.1 hypothetical protein Lepto782_12460 [Leptospira interrogans serovar Canicola]
MKIIIDISPAIIAELNKPVIGRGGWQSLLRKLKKNISGNQLILDVVTTAQIARYFSKYGQGGFEDRLKPIIDKVNELISALRNATS